MKIALWNLGSLEHKIAANKDMVQKLKQMLDNFDENKEELQHLIWGPELSVTVIDTDENLVISSEEQVEKIREILNG